MSPRLLALVFAGCPAFAQAADEPDPDAWQLANAIEDVKANAPDACIRLEQALQHWWLAPNRAEWPRVMRLPIPKELGGWRLAADECTRRGLQGGADGGRPWGVEQLFVSPVLQDAALRTQVIAPLRERGSVETTRDGGVDWVRRGGGAGGYTLPIGVREQHASADPAMSVPVVQGPLASELVHRVIRSNRGQIRHCFEERLSSRPGLGGRVEVKFTISLEGTVSTAEIAKSTLGHVAVEDCVLTRVRAWNFPRPKGGVAVVNYPFLFVQTDGG